MLGFAPFVGAAALAWITVRIGSKIDWVQYDLSVVLALLAGALTMATMLGARRQSIGTVASALVFLAAVGLLRNSAGGVPSGAGTIGIIPVFQTALYSRSRRNLILVLCGLALFYLLPVLLVGPPAYPHSQYRAGLLTVTVSSVIGLATQALVARVRHEVSVARNRGRMLEQVTEVVHKLFESPQARIDVCEAARSISGATVVALYEPSPDSDTLSCSAVTEVEREVEDMSARKGSAVHEVYLTGVPKLINTDIGKRVGNRELWEATGRPVSGLYQPLVKDQVVRGVLLVAWPEPIPEADPRTQVVALLAHEAAAVIARADAIENLTGEAQTDPLTGLPNRRAWDAHLKRLMADDRPLAIAMLDFDHFKQFNDTYGHPAGDRLLKEAAAVWRDQLRAGDLLARLGGEEFGLLLAGCDGPTAVEIVERLRSVMPRGRTCSAGIVVLRPGESADSAIARADHALYRAKARGRDRAELSGVKPDPAVNPA